ncbi:hypothetical protein ONA70_07735 [Micromonospora yasonensis]|uniref:hypothetical protein n=1 Tax=Micromonospora yasonensis TaxID=1128667 RepID=UPI002231B6CE|nr:hypothetical protein [Micromonospora yasonensis]MCW3839987.1 hypothetical protein [Micromonospora yasonensis]
MNERYPGPGRFVGDELAELVERPRVQRDPLGPSEPYPVADAREVLQGDAAAGAFGLVTICLAMQWLTSAANRPSLRRRAFNSRLADLVPMR